MTLQYYDMQDVVYNTLRGDASLCLLLAAGAGSIYAAGKMTSKNLEDHETTRRAAATPNQALAVTVEWAGEKELNSFTHLSEQNVIIRIHDKPVGASYNIKRVREKIKNVLKAITLQPDGAAKGILRLSIISTSGLDWDISLGTAFEAILVRTLVSDHEVHGF